MGQCDARVFRGEGWQLGESFGNLAGTRKQLVGGDDLVDGAPLLGRLGVEFLAGQDELAAADAADHILP